MESEEPRRADVRFIEWLGVRSLSIRKNDPSETNEEPLSSPMNEHFPEAPVAHRTRCRDREFARQNRGVAVYRDFEFGRLHRPARWRGSEAFHYLLTRLNRTGRADARVVSR